MKVIASGENVAKWSLLRNLLKIMILMLLHLMPDLTSLFAITTVRKKSGLNDTRYPTYQTVMRHRLTAFAIREEV